MSTVDAPVARSITPMNMMKSAKRGNRLEPLLRSGSDDWTTPAHIITRVIATFGAVPDCDPSSDAAHTVPARIHFTIQDDGLTRPWVGNLYVNPPYGRAIGAWVAKALAEHASGHATQVIMLLPARPDTRWWQLLDPFPVAFLRGRLRFGGAPSSAPFPSAMVYLGLNLGGFADAFGDIALIRVAHHDCNGMASAEAHEWEAYGRHRAETLRAERSVR